MPEELTLEDTPVETVTPPAPEPLNTDDLLNRERERVREEEKRKLYSTLEKEKAKAKQAEDKLSTLEAQLKELNAFKEQAELEKLGEKERLERQLTQLQNKLTDAERVAAAKQAELDEKIKLYEVANYRVRRIKEVGLDPDFEDFVVGSTEEEIEAALNRAAEKERRLKEKFTVVPEAPRTPPAPPPSAPPSPYGAPNPTTEMEVANIRNRNDLEAMKRKLGLLR